LRTTGKVLGLYLEHNYSCIWESVLSYCSGVEMWGGLLKDGCFQFLRYDIIGYKERMTRGEDKNDMSLFRQFM
jgi:hypothetical protein